MKHVILVKTDRSCEMAAVYLNDELVMSGNYWDFHNGCHGIHKYGEFNSVDDLVRQIAGSLSPEFVPVKREKYEYE